MTTPLPLGDLVVMVTTSHSPPPPPPIQHTQMHPIFPTILYCWTWWRRSALKTIGLKLAHLLFGATEQPLQYETTSVHDALIAVKVALDVLKHYRNDEAFGECYDLVMTDAAKKLTFRIHFALIQTSTSLSGWGKSAPHIYCCHHVLPIRILWSRNRKN